jgi:hypothetical protein
VTWLAPLGLAGLILLASVQCWPAYPRWSARLREQAFLAGAAVAAVALVPICWPLGLLLALACWRDRTTTSPAVRTWAVAGVLWVLTATTPAPWRWVIPAAYVATALGQTALLGAQLLRWRGRGFTYLDLHNALHGSMGTRFFAGLLIAQAMPLAPLWALPPLAVGLSLSSSATALVVALAGLLVAYPAWTGSLLAAAVPVGLAVLALRNGWAAVCSLRPFGDGMRERWILWRLMGARWTRCSWRVRLVGGGHDAFTTQSRWWARIDGPLTRVHLHGTNDGLQALLEVGLVGTLALGWLVASALAHGGLGDPLTGTLVAILLGSLTQFPLHAAHMAGPSLILLALLGTR